MNPELYWLLVQQQREQQLADARVLRARQSPHRAQHRRATRVR